MSDAEFHRFIRLVLRAACEVQRLVWVLGISDGTVSLALHDGDAKPLRLDVSRWAQPAGKVQPMTVGDLNCANPGGSTHCNVDYDGKKWDYLGHISRDQYQGVMMGFALAYEALGEVDEPTRAIIRDDVVELLQELMKDRTVKMQVTYNGTSLPGSVAAGTAKLIW